MEKAIKSFAAILCLPLFASGQTGTASDTLTQAVNHQDRTIHLRMVKESVRAANFEVLLQNANGGYAAHTPGEVRTYLGTVDEYPDALVAGYLHPDARLEARVYLDRGLALNTLGNRVTGQSGSSTPTLVYPNKDLGYVTSDKAVYAWTQALDASHAYVSSQPNLETLLAKSEFSINKIKAIFLRDALLVPELGRFIIRADADRDPYRGISSVYDCIGPTRNEWENNQKDAQRWIASSICPGAGGGIAYYPGNHSSFGSTGDFEAVGRHELGHNWNANDYQAGSPEGPTIMCGNSLSRFNAMSVGPFLKRRDQNAGKLRKLAQPLQVDVPPYAALDILTINAAGPERRMDVLNNDHDANGDALEIVSVQPISKNGAAIRLSPGTGPGGRAEVVYTQPVSRGFDHFSYKIRDAKGKTATGLVFINFNAEPLVAVNGAYPGERDAILAVGRDEVRLVVGSPDPFRFALYTLSGQQVFSFEGRGPIHRIVPLPGRERGVYYAKLNVETRTLWKKLAWNE